MTQTTQRPDSPVDPDALFQQALYNHRAGLLAEAEEHYRQFIALRTDFAGAYNNLAVCLWQQGRIEEAQAPVEQALVLQPDYADAHNTMGNVLRALGKLDEAAEKYRQAIALHPDHVEAHNNLGNVLHDQKQFNEAQANYEKALALRPEYAAAHNGLGNAFRGQGKLAESQACLERAIELWPDYAEAYYNLGLTLWHQDKLAEAQARYEQALEFRADYPEALNNLGHALREQSKLDEARAAFGRLLALQPDSVDAQTGLAGCYLVEGDYQHGWPLSEARLRRPGPVSPPDLPRWQGEPLAGRSLLFVAEQGLGDTLQFVRYAKLFKAQGARVLLGVQPALARLLEKSTDWDELVVLEPAVQFPRADYYLSLLSAPVVLKTDAATIPAKVPYLSADRELTQRWRKELAGIDGFKVGIVWQGSRDYHFDRWRSIPLAEFAPLARLPGVRLVSLQKGFGTEQIATAGFPVLDLSSRLDEASGPFRDTAAVIANLDLVVAPDSAMTHLAGALGAPVWAALPLVPDWRWLLDREDSPWYPTMRLFRQTTIGRWTDVFERIARAIPKPSSKGSLDVWL